MYLRLRVTSSVQEVSSEGVWSIGSKLKGGSIDCSSVSLGSAGSRCCDSRSRVLKEPGNQTMATGVQEGIREDVEAVFIKGVLA
jgi:hypothetical protein